MHRQHNRHGNFTKEYDRPSPHCQPAGRCMQANSHQHNTQNGTASATRHHCAPHGDDDDGTNYSQLTYSLRRHRPAPCRNICPMGRAGWKQPSIIMPRPVSRPPDQHHTTTMNNHARIQWGVGWRTNEQTSARKKDVHGCSNERKYAAESKITVSERPESYAMNDVRTFTNAITTVSTTVSGGGRQRHTSSRSLRAGGAGHSQTTTRRKAHQLKTRRPSVWVTQYTRAAAVHACAFFATSIPCSK